MAATDLVLAKPLRRKEYVVPKSLLRKHKMTFWDKTWLYLEFTLMIPALIVFISSTIGVVHFSLGLGQTFSILGIVFSAIALFFCLMVWFTRIEEENYYKRPFSFATKEKIIMLDKNRRRAAHAAKRKNRAADVDYKQYSWKSIAVGSELRFEIYAHTRSGEEDITSTRYFMGHNLVKNGFQANIGKWVQEGQPYIRLTNPRFEDVQEITVELDNLVDLLEENSYQENVKKREIEGLAYLTNRPQSSDKIVGEHLKRELEREFIS